MQSLCTSSISRILDYELNKENVKYEFCFQTNLKKCFIVLSVFNKFSNLKPWNINQNSSANAGHDIGQGSVWTVLYLIYECYIYVGLNKMLPYDSGVAGTLQDTSL